MFLRKTFLLFFAALSGLCACAPKSTYSSSGQERSAAALVDRITSGRSSAFDIRIEPVQIDGRDWFAFYAENGKIVLEGNDGVSVASALNAYLKQYCGWHLSWCGSSTALPEKLPLPESKILKTSPYKYRYYLNYCTFNYTMSWWDAERWRKEVDFMALNGVNMPLAVTGQNSVWQRVYRKLGFTDEELASFFSGPAYFNWFWMGNLDGWGGPLPQNFIDFHEELQKDILSMERSLGMTPVLPAFTGHVPPAFSEKFPDVKVTKSSWVNFAPVSVLDPSEELFSTIGRMFLEEQTKTYGTNHFYSADTFNENTPPTDDSLYLNDISQKVYAAMADVDPQAVWVMQGWLFHHERKFWGDRQIQALLNAVPDENMLILDLYSERSPVWNRTESYYGKPWIWCMLQNFGQNVNLSGNASSVANDPAAAMKESENMCGIGLTMEGIEQNPAIFALMFENVWIDGPVDIPSFIKSYTAERYGHNSVAATEAWEILLSSVYENQVNSGGNESIITGRPNFLENPGGTTNTKLHYDNERLLEAWGLMMSCAEEYAGSDGFRYDLVDVTRQVLANYASVLQQKAAADYRSRDAEAFALSSKAFLDLISDMESLLSTRSEFLLGRWLESAKALGRTPEESALYEKNARNLLTLWGDRNCRIKDYACRQWAGMMGGFYYPRWERFFSAAAEALADGTELDMVGFNASSADWEWDWVNSNECYAAQPSGSAIVQCESLYEKYHAALGGSLSDLNFSLSEAAYE